MNYQYNIIQDLFTGYIELYTLNPNINKLPNISVIYICSPKKSTPKIKTVTTVIYPTAVVLLKSIPFNDTISNRVNNTHKAPLKAQFITKPI